MSSPKVKAMSVLDQWKGTMPVLLPIIGEFAGTICKIKDYRGTVVVDGKHTEQKWREIVFNRLHIVYDGKKFGREIRVIHYGLKYYKNFRKEPYTPSPEQWPDFCLRTRDWKPRLELETWVQEQARKLLSFMNMPPRTSEYLTGEERLINHEIGLSKSSELEMYALRQAIKNIVKTREADVHNYELRRIRRNR